jgi:hypothetical protein
MEKTKGHFFTLENNIRGHNQRICCPNKDKKGKVAVGLARKV